MILDLAIVEIGVDSPSLGISLEQIPSVDELSVEGHVVHRFEPGVGDGRPSFHGMQWCRSLNPGALMRSAGSVGGQLANRTISLWEHTYIWSPTKE